MYFVSGEVEVQLQPAAVLLGPGTCFGEMSLLPGSPRNATIVATRHARFWPWTLSIFEGFSAARPISPELAMRKRSAGSRLASAPGGERLVIMRREARGGAGLAIEGRFQLTSEKAPDTILKNCLRRQAAPAAEAVEPAHPGGHMTDLVAIDPPQDGGALRIADALELSDHSRRHIEPARLEHERHDGKPGEQVVGSRCGRFP